MAAAVEVAIVLFTPRFGRYNGERIQAGDMTDYLHLSTTIDLSSFLAYTVALLVVTILLWMAVGVEDRHWKRRYDRLYADSKDEIAKLRSALTQLERQKSHPSSS